MRFSELEDAAALNERLERIERAIGKLTESIEKLNDRFDQWLRWVIGLQLGLYMVVIAAYFVRK